MTETRTLTDAERAAALAHPLASLTGIALVIQALADMGALCPRCGYATRVKSRRWAVCTRCGERVARGFIPPAREGAPGSGNL